MLGGNRWDGLRQRLVSEMKASGSLCSERVERAFLCVPRLPFVSGYVDSPEEAYRDRVIALRSGVSTASQPSIMAMMLESLEVSPGHRVLEVGTASGYGAALLAELAGLQGEVTTVEMEADLARRAAEKLRDQGYGRVRVLAGDGGAFLLPPGSVDRIMVTAGAGGIPVAWLRELAPAGLLLTPFQLGPAALLMRIRRQGPGDRWRGGFLDVPVAFVPLRGGERQDKGDLVQLASWDKDLVGATLEEGRPWCRDEEEYVGLMAWAGAEPVLPSPAEALRDWLSSGRPRASACLVQVKAVENQLKMSIGKRIYSDDTEQLQHDFA